MRMLVLGAGLQGTACAFDLLQNPEVERVLLADMRVGAVPAFLQSFVGERLQQVAVDVRDAEAMRALFAQCDAVCSAIPYYFNLSLAQLAVESGVHFADLGGNTEIVRQQQQLDANAKARGDLRSEAPRSNPTATTAHSRTYRARAACRPRNRRHPAPSRYLLTRRTPSHRRPRRSICSASRQAVSRMPARSMRPMP